MLARTMKLSLVALGLALAAPSFGETLAVDGQLAIKPAGVETPQRGSTMALHSTVGFGLSAAGAWGFGVVLDAAGGPANETAWVAGFGLLAVSILLGPLALWWSARAHSDS